MKQNFTTWAGYLLVAITAMVAISFTSCTDPFYGGERDPQKDFDTPLILSVDQPGPIEAHFIGAAIELNVECNAVWQVKLEMIGAAGGMMEFSSTEVNPDNNIAESSDEYITGNGKVLLRVTPNSRAPRSGKIRIITDSEELSIVVNQAVAN